MENAGFMLVILVSTEETTVCRLTVAKTVLPATLFSTQLLIGTVNIQANAIT